MKYQQTFCAKAMLLLYLRADMRLLPLKPNHKRIALYHESLAEFEKLGVKRESAL